MAQPCEGCGKKTEKLCSGCKSVHYCCVEHQRAHWKQHKKSCRLLAATKPEEPSIDLILRNSSLNVHMAKVTCKRGVADALVFAKVRPGADADSKELHRFYKEGQRTSRTKLHVPDCVTTFFFARVDMPYHFPLVLADNAASSGKIKAALGHYMDAIAKVDEEHGFFSDHAASARVCIADLLRAHTTTLNAAMDLYEQALSIYHQRYKEQLVHGPALLMWADAAQGHGMALCQVGRFHSAIVLLDHAMRFLYFHHILNGSTGDGMQKALQILRSGWLHEMTADCHLRAYAEDFQVAVFCGPDLPSNENLNHAERHLEIAIDVFQQVGFATKDAARLSRRLKQVRDFDPTCRDPRRLFQ